MKKIINLVRSKINRQYTESEQFDSLIYLAASMLANFLNFMYNAYLGRSIGFADFGLIVLFGSFLNVSQIPLAAFSKAITHKSAYLLGKYGIPVRSFWSDTRARMLKPSLLLTVIWLFAIPLMAWFFKADSFIPFLLLTPIWSIGLWASVDSGYLSGTLMLKTTAIIMVAEILIKFLISIFLINLSLHQYIYLAIPVSNFISFLMGWGAVLAMRPKKKVKALKVESDLSIPYRFFVSSIFAKVTAVAFLSMDVMLAKHYLSAEQAGQYALLSLVGKMVYFLGALFNQFVIPFVSRDEGAGKNSKKTFDILMALTVITVVIGYVVVGAFGKITVPFLLGSKASVIVQYLPFYVMAMGCLAVGSGIVSYHQSKQNHLFAAVSLLLSVLTLFGIVMHHNSISDINRSITIGGIVYFAVVYLLHRFELLQDFLYSLVLDLKSIFAGSNRNKNLNSGLNILILNWRDTKHKWAGGAESYVQELGQRWVEQGNKVTLFCGNDGRGKREQTIKGVHVIRRGNFLTVYIWAFIYYMVRFRGRMDVIIDCENGIPFFTPIYARIPVYLVIHHVHQEVFRKHLKFPLRNIAQFLEGKMMPFVYRNNKVITVSESTKKEIVKNGISNIENIEIVHNGVNVTYKDLIAKSKHPLISYVGRLKHYKNIDIALKAFAKISIEFPNAKFSVVGQGEALQKLKNLSKKLGILNNVQFYGRVPESMKVFILRKSWFAVQPSMMEGWGITVIEANACGTPVIASRVNGLVDSIVHKKTGMLVTVKDIDELSRIMKLMLSDHKLRGELSLNARNWSENFSWDKSAQKFITLINQDLKVEIDIKPAVSIRKLATSINV